MHPISGVTVPLFSKDGLQTQMSESRNNSSDAPYFRRTGPVHKRGVRCYTLIRKRGVCCYTFIRKRGLPCYTSLSSANVGSAVTRHSHPQTWGSLFHSHPQTCGSCLHYHPQTWGQLLHSHPQTLGSLLQFTLSSANVGSAVTLSSANVVYFGFTVSTSMCTIETTTFPNGGRSRVHHCWGGEPLKILFLNQSKYMFGRPHRSATASTAA